MMNLTRRTARFLHPLAAATVVALVFAQVYLIAEYVFGDANALTAHMALGKVVVLFSSSSCWPLRWPAGGTSGVK